jgi:hypothetical protein
MKSGSSGFRCSLFEEGRSSFLFPSNLHFRWLGPQNPGDYAMYGVQEMIGSHRPRSLGRSKYLQSAENYWLITTYLVYIVSAVHANLASSVMTNVTTVWWNPEYNDQQKSPFWSWKPLVGQWAESTISLSSIIQSHYVPNFRFVRNKSAIWTMP